MRSPVVTSSPSVIAASPHCLGTMRARRSKASHRNSAAYGWTPPIGTPFPSDLTPSCRSREHTAVALAAQDSCPLFGRAPRPEREVVQHRTGFGDLRRCEATRVLARLLNPPADTAGGCGLLIGVRLWIGTGHDE